MIRRSRPRRLPLPALYQLLRARFGHAGWWPGDGPFEVCVGAVLVQNTSWRNVEKALAVLRGRGLLSFEALARLDERRLAPLVRSSGVYRVKARRLRALLDFIGERCGGRVEAMRAWDAAEARAALLGVHGIGRETADSIALYAAGHPLFVIDAYTRRILARLGLARGDEPYDALQALFHRRLPRDPALYNDFHAQLVALGKDFCRPRPRCPGCPLAAVCARRGVARAGSRPATAR
ncbi:MAG: endonuclease [Vicinamibacteria bacterium]